MGQQLSKNLNELIRSQSIVFMSSGASQSPQALLTHLYPQISEDPYQYVQKLVQQDPEVEELFAGMGITWPTSEGEMGADGERFFKSLSNEQAEKLLAALERV